MEPCDYADIRRHALVRAAVELGVPADEAPALVERVLEEQARRIRRAQDPDPVVQEALAEAVRRRRGRIRGGSDGGPGRGPGRWTGARSRWPVVAALTIALVAVGVAATALRRDPPPDDHLRADQVPSVFGYDAGSARRLLTERGLEVSITPLRSCEILGRAVGTNPPTGEVYEQGEPITVFAAIPARQECLTDYQERSSAWRFLDFAAGRAPAPVFARRVRVYRDGDEPTVLRRGEAADLASWQRTGVLSALRDATQRVVLTEDLPVTYSVPSLQVVPLRDRRGPCAAPLAPAVARLPGLSFVLKAPDTGACLVHVDLLRTDDDPAAPVAAVVLRAG